MSARAVGGCDASLADTGGKVSATGATGSLTKPILEINVFFCLTISRMRRALQGPAIPLILLHFLLRAGVAATRLSGNTTSGLNSDVNRAVCSHSVHLQHRRHMHPHGKRPHRVCRYM